MRPRTLGAAVALWLLPNVATAGSWVDCTSGAARGGFDSVLSSICFEWTATGDSTLIAPARCASIEIGPLIPSTTDTSTGATAYVYRCGSGNVGSAAGAGQCSKMLVDTDGDGIVTAADDVTLDGVTFGRQGQQYQTATLLYVSPQAATSAKTARLMITCH